MKRLSATLFLIFSLPFLTQCLGTKTVGLSCSSLEEKGGFHKLPVIVEKGFWGGYTYSFGEKKKWKAKDLGYGIRLQDHEITHHGKTVDVKGMTILKIPSHEIKVGRDSGLYEYKGWQRNSPLSAFCRSLSPRIPYKQPGSRY